MFERTTASRWLPIVCLTVVLLWYPSLTVLLGYPPSRPIDFGLVFNSMAEHLLAGRFDVDPEAIGAEGFESGDRTVSYFGIFCALLRIPLVVLPGYARTDITWWSCLVATWIATWFQIAAVSLVWRNGSPSSGSRTDWLAAGLTISIVLGGQHIQFLRPSIYQEPIDWALAQTMAFVFLALRGTLALEGFDRRTLSLMALCAGLALLTRVSFGVSLYAAQGLLLLARARVREWPVPIGILLVFAAAAGVVNEGRWGNPFTFADYTHYGLSLDVAPDRLGRLAAYGTFNSARIWLGIGYYFVPIWIWIRADGHVLFAESQATLMDSMELPPGSFLLTDPLLLALAMAGTFRIRDRVRTALAVGLSASPVLMLCAISMAHRYRMEFYPLLFLTATFAVANSSRAAGISRRFRVAIIFCVVLSVIASHAMAVLYARSPLGPGEFYLERFGLIGTYGRPPR